jgi:hypothetical protein
VEKFRFIEAEFARFCDGDHIMTPRKQLQKQPAPRSELSAGDTIEAKLRQNEFESPRVAQVRRKPWALRVRLAGSDTTLPASFI